MVPRGWLTRLARHLDDPALGLIGPATNRTCNEAQIDIPYQTYGEFQDGRARPGVRSYEGERLAIRMPMMFCVAFRRDTYERLGPLDERYEVGMFEDEDYALRAKAAGLHVAWTPEVYVHHAYHASIGKLLPTGEYMRLVQTESGTIRREMGHLLGAPPRPSSFCANPVSAGLPSRLRHLDRGGFTRVRFSGPGDSHRVRHRSATAR